MNDHDSLQRFIFEDAPVRGEIVRLQKSYQRIITQHAYPLFIQKLLGECLAVATLLSSVVKFKGRLTVQFQGKSGLKLLIAQSDDEHHIRGLAQWQPTLTEETLQNALQTGVLAIIMQGIKGHQRYQGIVPWRGSSLAQCMEGYFQDSEQLPTRIWLTVDENQVGGLLLQVMPSSDKKNMPELFPATHAWEQIIQLTDTLSPAEFQTLDNETILRRLYSVEHEVRVFSSDPVVFGCTCSRSRSEQALLLLSKEEIEEELREKQQMVVTCDFCHQTYTFDRVDVERVFKKQDGSGPEADSTHVH